MHLSHYVQIWKKSGINLKHGSSSVMQVFFSVLFALWVYLPQS